MPSLSAVVEFGQMWTNVSGRVGRTSHDCRDRYRNHFLDSEHRVKGKWDPAVLIRQIGVRSSEYRRMEQGRRGKTSGDNGRIQL
jgi:Myb-like DNA-binding domain